MQIHRKITCVSLTHMSTRDQKVTHNLPPARDGAEALSPPPWFIVSLDLVSHAHTWGGTRSLFILSVSSFFCRTQKALGEKKKALGRVCTKWAPDKKSMRARS